MGVQFAGNILVQSDGGPLPISQGGTGQTTAPTAINALLPVQTGQSGKVLTTNGTDVSWSATAGGSPGGADTQIQFNDSGTFGGSANFSINKTTGALTALSTLTSLGLMISGNVETTRALKYQTAGSDRWLSQANNTAETGASAGSDFEFVRVADNGATQNQVYTVARSTGVVDFKVAPTVNGGAIGGVTSFNTRLGAITLTSSDVTTALGFTPVNKAGDTMTGSLTATGFSGPLTGNASTATSIAGGAANRIAYQLGAGSTSFITAPSVASTFLQWTGSAFTWAAGGASLSAANTWTNTQTFTGTAPQMVFGVSSSVTPVNGFIQSADGIGTAPAANFSIYGGSGAAGGHGGAINLTAGNGGSGTYGGNVTVSAGGGVSGAVGAGGIYLYGGSQGFAGVSPGATFIQAGTANASAMTAGTTTIAGGDGSFAASVGGDVLLRGGNGNASGSGGAIIHSTTTNATQVERFRILANGAWSVGTSGTAYGTTGQVLTSNGNAAPTWSAAPASSNLSGGAATQIPFQSATSTTAFSSKFTWNDTTNTFTVGALDSTDTTIVPPTASVQSQGSRFVIKGGTGFGAAAGGAVVISGGVPGSTSYSPGAVNINGGDGITSTGLFGANLNLRGGIGNGGSGGIITLSTSGTGATTIERLRISANGGFGLSGANYGTAGQVLTSTGDATPTWSTPSSGGVTSFNTRTGAVTLTSSDVTTALTYTPVNKAGDTMTGLLVLSADPTAALGAATKQYVDNMAAGVNVHAACETATSAPLAACTYSNGASGVGATLTANANGGLGAIGGYTPVGGWLSTSRILVKDQSAGLQNGIYVVTQSGSGSLPWILTRATDFDGSPTAEISAGDLTFVQEGTLAGTQWVEVAVGTGAPGDYIIIGTDAITFSQFSGAGTYTAGTGLSLTGTQFANTGVTSNVAGTNITVSSATGAVTIGLATEPTITGTNISGTAASLNIGGNAATATTATSATTATKSTNLIGAAWGLPYQSATDTTSFIAGSGATTGYVLTSTGTTSAPTWQAASAGTVNANSLTGTTLASGVTASSLTSVGTLSTLAVTGSITSNSLTVGYLEMPQRITGTTTLVMSDSGKHIYNTSASQAYTIPVATSVAYPIGTALTFVNTGSGTCTIATSDTMYLAGSAAVTGTRTLAAYGMATALKVSGVSTGGVWIISGTGLT